VGQKRAAHMPREYMRSITHNLEDSSHGSTPKPLFRPEVIATRDNLNGAILLIRPLSLTLLCWTAAAITAACASFLLIGHYTPVKTIPVSLATTARDVGKVIVTLSVPPTEATALLPGKTLVLLCRGCGYSGQTVRLLTTIATRVPRSSLSDPYEAIVLSLTASESSQLLGDFPINAGFVEAEIPMPSEPLYRWFFHLGRS
jgi:hypothetical protein